MKNFVNWEKRQQLLEHFGNGEETFTEKIDYNDKLRNLDISTPSSWGDIESAAGTLTYTASIEVSRDGIKGIEFHIDEIAILITSRTYKDENDDDGTEQEFEVVIKNPTQEIEVHKAPFYLENIDINFDEVEKDNGDYSKARVEATFGQERR